MYALHWTPVATPQKHGAAIYDVPQCIGPITQAQEQKQPQVNDAVLTYPPAVKFNTPVAEPNVALVALDGTPKYNVSETKV